MRDPNAAAADERDRRRLERRTATRVAELTLPELRRITLTSLLFAVVLALFLWMVRAVLIAAILGMIIAFYLREMAERLTRVFGGRRSVAALVSLTAVILPFVAVALYSYLELIGVSDYLTANREAVARDMGERMRSLPLDPGARAVAFAERGIFAMARFAEQIPSSVARAMAHFAVASTVFLVTAFYFLSRGEEIEAYVRARIPPRYAELAGALETSVTGVLRGAIFATLVTQAAKTVVVFVLNVTFGVPLAAVLAIASFVIGFFPVVGSWSIYFPVAGWLLLFRDDLFGAVTVLAVGFLVNTLFISTYLRPKLAADKSQVLDFYWMFVGLVTGVFAFGLPGVLLGPILIGLLKAILDTLLTRSAWRLFEREDDWGPGGVVESARVAEST